jgi:hypothetical protein
MRVHGVVGKSAVYYLHQEGAQFIATVSALTISNVHSDSLSTLMIGAANWYEFSIRRLRTANACINLKGQLIFV